MRPMILPFHDADRADAERRNQRRASDMSNLHTIPSTCFDSSHHPPSNDARRDSATSSSSKTSTTNTDKHRNPSVKTSPHAAVDATAVGVAHNGYNYRTRSIPGPMCSMVVFEREAMDTTSPPADDEIIIATVRVSDGFRRASLEGGEELPTRPRARNFMRRMSTRWQSGAEGPPGRWTALKMPRIEYKRHFARDAKGNYVGTEPEREWNEGELEERFGKWQEWSLRAKTGVELEEEGREGKETEEDGEGKGESGEGEVGKKGWSTDGHGWWVMDGEGAKRKDDDENWWDEKK